MRKGEAVRSYTAEELRAMRRRGEDRTDWAKVDAMLEHEVVDFFKVGGKGHITRMQAVLRAYLDAHKRRAGGSS